MPAAKGAAGMLTLLGWLCGCTSQAVHVLDTRTADLIPLSCSEMRRYEQSAQGTQPVQLRKIP